MEIKIDPPIVPNTAFALDGAGWPLCSRPTEEMARGIDTPWLDLELLGSRTG